MIQIQIQLNESTLTLVKQRACAENKSLNAVVRDALDQYLMPPSIQPSGLEGFTFIGSGRSIGKHEPLSERHDEALADDFAK